MHRQPLLQTLDEYERLSREKFSAFAGENERLHQMRDFVLQTPACFKRENQAGHLTGSAFVLSPDQKKVLLTFHAKLKKWLQLGGHADGHPLLHEVALREAQEEGGVKELQLLSEIPFDLDIHPIPARKDVAEHLHFDVRYLMISSSEEIAISEESLKLEWIALDKISDFTQEESVLRQVRKALLL
jgi:8-oxo-dGTP pyrophosphatase MutT (NUDIX family)